MADADEDLIPRAQPSASTALTDPSADLEDEAQDFRFLAHLTNAASKLTASSSATAATSATTSTLPRRGEKDFEPNPTQAQSNNLALSRAAMHDALSVERVLAPRNPVVGQYLPEPEDWRWDVVPRESQTTVGGRRRSGGGKGGRCVVVEKFNTTYARNVGAADYRNWTWLLPEEALFLIERGTLDVRWPDEKVRAFMKGNAPQEGTGEEQEEEQEEEELAADRIVLRGTPQDVDDGGTYEHEDGDEEGMEDEPDTQHDDGSVRKPKRKKIVPLQVGEMPMSLQGAYASLIGKSGLTLERYYVYAGLRRMGYVVQRALTWDDDSIDEDDVEHSEDEQQQHSNGHIVEPSEPLLRRSTPPPPTSTSSSLQSYSAAITLINRLVSFLFPPQAQHYRPATGPLIYPGLYKNYHDIFRTLSLIPYHSSSSSSSSSRLTVSRPRPPYTISWDVFKPGNPPPQSQKSLPNKKYRKSAPPPPDFRIVVIDARVTTTIPTMTDLAPLFDSLTVGEEQQQQRRDNNTTKQQQQQQQRPEAKMKSGLVSVVLAVVDCGLVSYLRFADACSGTEGRVFETKLKTTKGGKKGGGGRWKGKGQQSSASASGSGKR